MVSGESIGVCKGLLVRNRLVNWDREGVGGMKMGVPQKQLALLGCFYSNEEAPRRGCSAGVSE